MASELAQLKGEPEIARQKILSNSPQAMSPSARNLRIVELENMLATSSSTLVSMASELSKAEERERLFSGRGRWNQVRSLTDAKNLMNHLFNLAALSRCQLRDNEIVCKEKDSIITNLKEKLYTLNGYVRHLEAQKATSNEINMKVPRKSTFFNRGRESGGEVEADMDTSDSEEMLDVESDESDEDWVESGKVITKRRSKEKKFDIDDENTVTESNGHICCSCSKNSSCKTKKCECRLVSKWCGSYCSCNTLKCANRENSNPILDDEKSMEQVSQGTLLLQGALQQRKPLSDVGNAQVSNPKAAKPLKRKNWVKSTIQLVTEAVEPIAPQPNEAPARDEIPLRLPRAMETLSSESHPPFSDRNSVRSDEKENRIL